MSDTQAFVALEIPAHTIHGDALLAFNVTTGAVIALMPDDARDLWEAKQLFGWTPLGAASPVNPETGDTT